MALGLGEGESLPPLVDAFGEPPRSNWSSEEILPFAMRSRFDVAAAAAAVEGAEGGLEQERWRVYGEVAIGPAYEGGFGDFDGGGPVIGMELPIFDQNQARIARAEFQLRRQRRLLEDLRLRARGDVLAALAEVEFRRRQATALAARLAGAGAKFAARRTRESLSSEELLEIRRQALDSIAELRRAETDLQIAVWGARAD